ncbi:cytochrome-c oxidase [Neobacillus sp. SAB-20_R2A]|uniref:cytochrome-c oxidase n=1 Tax=Neobacillus sp. SAB-20_R2A TaxID=3120519 RepID=UPI003C6E962C
MGKAFLKVASIYFTIGVLAGITMGIIHDFRLASVHAHINLLGWVSMAIFGLIYHFYPQAANTKLAKTHFWFYNIGLPVMMIGIATQVLTGSMAALPVAVIGSIVVVVGVICFTINLFKHVGKGTNVQSGNKFTV